MKKLLLIPVLVLFFISCRKKDAGKESPEGKLYSVEFSTSSFNVDYSPVKTAISSNKKVSSVEPSDSNSGVNHIYYLVYKGDIYVKMIHQVRTDPKFGKIKDELAKGRYNVAFFASGEPLNITARENKLNFGKPGTVVYYERFLLDLEGDVRKNVELRRITALLRINIEDNVPISVKKIHYVVKYELSGENISTEMRISSGELDTFDTFFFTQTMVESNYGKPISLDIFLPYRINDSHPQEGSNVTVDIFAYDSTEQVIASDKIRFVMIGLDKKATLSGKLFDTNGGREGIQIRLPDTTLEELPVINF